MVWAASYVLHLGFLRAGTRMSMEPSNYLVSWVVTYLGDHGRPSSVPSYP